MIFASNTEADELKKTTCQLGTTPSYTISIIESTPIGSTKLYSIQYPDTSEHPIYMTQETTQEDAIKLSQGSDVRVICSGSPERTLIVTGEFSSNFIQGIILRYDSKLKALQRLDVSERSPVSKVYFGQNYFSAVVASDYRETSKKYLIYKYSSQKKASETPLDSDALPSARARQVITIQSRQNN